MPLTRARIGVINRKLNPAQLKYSSLCTLRYLLNGGATVPDILDNVYVSKTGVYGTLYYFLDRGWLKTKLVDRDSRRERQFFYLTELGERQARKLLLPLQYKEVSHESEDVVGTEEESVGC